jgi:hypothetical protein
VPLVSYLGPGLNIPVFFSLDKSFVIIIFSFYLSYLENPYYGADAMFDKYTIQK